MGIKNLIYLTLIKENGTKLIYGKKRRVNSYQCVCGSIMELRADTIVINKNCGCVNKVTRDIKSEIMRLKNRIILLSSNNNSIYISKKINSKKRDHKLFYVWENIKRRCYTVDHPKYKSYGAKGVTMCNEWLNNYYSFYDWSIANGYKEGLQLDKDILCDKLDIYPKIYSPSTCCFVDMATNLNHKSFK